MSSNNRTIEELGEIVRDFVVDDRDSIQALDQNLQASKLDGYGIIEGCTLSIGSGELGQGENTLETTAGRVLINGSEVSLPPLSIGIPAADDNDPRKDLVYATENGLAVRTGDPEPWDPPDQRREKAFRPAPPTKVPQQDNGTILGVVTVPANVSNIGGSDVQRRPVGANISVAGLEGIRAAIDQMAVDDLVVRNGSTISGDLSVSGSITTGDEPVAIDADLLAHIDDTGNPHSVTATQADALPITGGRIQGSIIWGPTLRPQLEYDATATSGTRQNALFDFLQEGSGNRAGYFGYRTSGGALGSTDRIHFTNQLDSTEFDLGNGAAYVNGNTVWHDANFDPDTKAETGAFENHSAQHESGGTDEVSVAGLSGRLADPQNADSYKGNDIDPNGDGVVTAAESADTATTADSATQAESATNADNLGGVEADQHVLRDGSRSVTALDILEELDLPTVESLPDPSTGTAGLFVYVTGGGTDPEGLYYHDGTEFNRLEAGSADVGALSELLIDTDKNWQGFNITNVGEFETTADAYIDGNLRVEQNVRQLYPEGDIVTGRFLGRVPSNSRAYVLVGSWTVENAAFVGALRGWRTGGSTGSGGTFHVACTSNNSALWRGSFYRQSANMNTQPTPSFVRLEWDGTEHFAIELDPGGSHHNYNSDLYFTGALSKTDVRIVNPIDHNLTVVDRINPSGQHEFIGRIRARNGILVDERLNIPVHTANPSGRTVGDMWLVDAAGQSDPDTEFESDGEGEAAADGESKRSNEPENETESEQ